MNRILHLISLFIFTITVGAAPDSPVHSGPYACTSFAVYSTATIYGMNFDYPDVEIRFTLNKSGNRKILQMEFQHEEGFFVPVAGVNSDGVFSSCQMLLPAAEQVPRTNPDEIYPWELHSESLLNYSSVVEVIDYLGSYQVINGTPSLHNHLADNLGNAMVIEVEDSMNHITHKQGDFSVMTNFPNHKFSDVSWQEVEGVGARRYQIAWKHISENLETYDVDLALETLELAKMEGDEWATRCSTVYNPSSGKIHIALQGDFYRTWIVSLVDETITTGPEFRGVTVWTLGPEGVLAADLMN